MEYGGVALVAAVIVVLAIMVPARIDKQTARVQSRELDRYSPDLRILNHQRVIRPEDCADASAAPGTLPAVGIGGNRPTLVGAVVPEGISVRAGIGANAVAEASSRSGADALAGAGAGDAANRARGLVDDALADPHNSARGLVDDGHDDRSSGQKGLNMPAPDAATPRVNSHSRAAATRQVSTLRARRAARIAQEQAAGQRRMVLCALAGAVTLVFILLAAFTAFSWAWVVLPAASLAGGLAVSRVAGAQAERSAQRENQELARLRQILNGSGAGNSQRPGVSSTRARSVLSDISADGDFSDDSVFSADGGVAAEGAVPTGADFSDEGVLSSGAVLSADADAEVSQATDADTQRREARRRVAAQAGHRTGDDAATPAAAETAGKGENSAQASSMDEAEGARTWAVARIPAPTYVSQERVARRIIHADTDIRGIPRVAAHVPARPVAKTGVNGAESTEQMAQRGAVTFNLDEVLDQRRA